MTLVEILQNPPENPRESPRGIGRGGGERKFGSACGVGVELEAAIGRFAKELGYLDNAPHR